METFIHLKSNISIDMTLLSIVNVFSQMCRIKIDGKDEMFLFECGPVAQNGKTMLMFSLVRQFSDGNDEPIQIHTDIIYGTGENTSKLSACSWHENYGDFIQAVLLSKAFEVCKNLPIVKLEIRAEKT